jgi:2-desacetyl-2-hydroxyethyl bacteriochlorophyllide A dehydrogenase
MTTAGMPALVWEGGREVAVREVPRPSPEPGWTLVDVAYAGICGTDLHICAGEHPRARPGLVLGHELAGTVASPAEGFELGEPVVVEPLLNCGVCRPCRDGQPHVCERLRLIGIDVAGGLAPQVAVPTERLVRLPAGSDLRLASFVEPLAVAVHAVRRSGLRLGESALVAGAGPIGLAVALAARLAGAQVAVVEPAEPRRRVAAELGFEALAAVDEGRPGFDVVFDSAAHPAVAAGVTSWAAIGGRIVVVGTYGTPTPVHLQAVTFRELTLIGTRVYTRADVEAAASLISSGRFDPEPLITATVPLDEGPEALDRLRGGSEIKVVIQPSPGAAA